MRSKNGVDLSDIKFSSAHFPIYKCTFAFYEDIKCVQRHAVLMSVSNLAYMSAHRSRSRDCMQCLTPHIEEPAVKKLNRISET